MWADIIHKARVVRREEAAVAGVEVARAYLSSKIY